MKRNWHKQFADGKHFYVKLHKKEVHIWENYNGNPHTRAGGGVSFTEFLGGKYQSIVKQNLGEEVLDNIIENVRSMVKNI